MRRRASLAVSLLLGSRCLRFFARHAVEERLQLLTHLEVRDLLGRDVDLLPGLGIAPLARCTVPETERAEASDLDLLAVLQRRDDAAQRGLDDDAGLDLSDVEALGHDPDQVRFRHCSAGRLDHSAELRGLPRSRY